MIKGKFTFTKFDLRKSELQVRTKSAVQLNQQFSYVKDDLDRKVCDSEITFELEERQTFEDQYYAIVANAKCFINENHPSRGASGKSCIKLPTIFVPSFNGTYYHELEIRDTFLSLIHNSKDIDNVQKLHYLL